MLRALLKFIAFLFLLSANICFILDMRYQWQGLAGPISPLGRYLSALAGFPIDSSLLKAPLWLILAACALLCFLMAFKRKDNFYKIDY